MVSRDLGLRKCALPDDKTDAEYICPNATASVQGQYQDTLYRYVTVNVKLCSGPGCKNASDVISAAQTARFTFWIYFHNYELGSVRRGYSRRTRVPKDTQYSIDFLLASRQIVTAPRIYVDSGDSIYALSSIEEFSPFLSTVVWKPGAVILRLLVRVSDSMMRDELKPYSFPSMFGDWGALWTALSLSLGALAFQYNQWTFERAVKKHLGRSIDFHSLFALDIKSADVKTLAADRRGSIQTAAQIRERLARLRQDIAAEVQDRSGTLFDYGQAHEELERALRGTLGLLVQAGERRRRRSMFSGFRRPSRKLRWQAGGGVPTDCGVGADGKGGDAFHTGYSTPDDAGYGGDEFETPATRAGPAAVAARRGPGRARAGGRKCASSRLGPRGAPCGVQRRRPVRVAGAGPGGARDRAPQREEGRASPLPAAHRGRPAPRRGPRGAGERRRPLHLDAEAELAVGVPPRKRCRPRLPSPADADSQASRCPGKRARAGASIEQHRRHFSLTDGPWRKGATRRFWPSGPVELLRRACSSHFSAADPTAS